MKRYIRRRLIQVIPIVFGITVLTYLIMKLAPGGPLANMVNPRTSIESINRAKAALGLDQPIFVQYINWMGQILQGNFGYSTFSGQPVLTMIGDRLGATLLLTGTAFLFSFLVGIPLGVYSATHKYTPGDYGLTVFSFVGISIPSFFFGMFFLPLCSVQGPGFLLYGFPASIRRPRQNGGSQKPSVGRSQQASLRERAQPALMMPIKP